MKKEKIIPKELNEFKLDSVIFEHYMERKQNPTKLPETIGPIIRGVDVGKSRYADTHPTYPLIDKTEGILEKDFVFEDYKVRWYCPEKVNGPAPCIFYIHGGGYVMGSVERLNNINRRLAELIEGVVVHIDYTLSPEAAYPVAINQCYDALVRMVNESETYRIDPNRIAIMGDSAGGNAAAAVALKDNNERRIKLMILYYPVVDFTNYSKSQFNINAYGENLHPLIHEKINALAKSTSQNSYIQEDIPLDNELISPLFAKDFTRFPKTVMITAEFDYLRLQCEEFVEKLQKAGVDTEYWMYAGTFHGFLERLHVFDASDDSLQRIKTLMAEHFKQ